MMKIGSQTGSIVNHIHSRAVIGQPEPIVGMGATVMGWTDRYPATVIAWDGKIVTVQEDHAKRVDNNGMSEMQDYEYTRNDQGSVHMFKREASGMWCEVRRNHATGRMNKVQGGKGFRIGTRDKYHDYSF